LLEYAGRDVFKVRIFPIEPHSRKEVKLRYSQLLRFDSGSLSYVYPLGTEKFSAQPIRSLSLKVELNSEGPLGTIYSPSHKVEIKREGSKRALVGFEASNERPDTDFQLVFSRQEARAGDLGVSLLSFRKPEAGSSGGVAEGDGYFLLLAAPSFEAKNQKPAPKDVIFVFDSSGSMAGAKLAQAKKALGFCVENLNPEDRFEIVRFSTDAEPLFGKLVSASEEHRKRAGDFIERVKPMGGTAIADALRKALSLRESGTGSASSANPFVVVFLTDGLPTVGDTSEEGILAGIARTGGNARIFPFGIGSDVNTHLLDRMAENTRAFSQYVLASEDIEVKVSSFFTRIKEPALTNLRLEFSGDAKVSKLYPGELPDLFRGDQLVLVGRYSGSGKAEAHLKGMAAGEEVNFRFPVEFAETNHGPGVYSPALGDASGRLFVGRDPVAWRERRVARGGRCAGPSVWDRDALHGLPDRGGREQTQRGQRQPVALATQPR
jgi:Ca-activated chloride channel family protein